MEPPLGREKRVLPKSLASNVVPRNELERQVEAADADDLEEGLEARLDHPALPASDDGALAAAEVGELLLRESGSEPRLANEDRAPHAAGV